LILLARSVYGNRIVKIKPELLLEQKYQTIVEGFFFSFAVMKKTKTEMLYSREAFVVWIAIKSNIKID
jgi:hypothetical protein